MSRSQRQAPMSGDATTGAGHPENPQDCVPQVQFLGEGVSGARCFQNTHFNVSEAPPCPAGGTGPFQSMWQELARGT